MDTGGKEGDANVCRTRYLEKGSTDREVPFYHFEELALEHVELRDGYTADLGVDAVAAERVAETFAGHDYRRDHEAVTGEGGKDEGGHPDGDLIDIVQGDE